MKKNLFSDISLNLGDCVLVSSSILKYLIKKKEKNLEKEANKVIDDLIEKIGSSGTLLFPTYNWDFCKGIQFDYKKTLSMSGALGNIALKRDDFLRTKNPIYSFAVTGKNSKTISELTHKSCFGLDSPFGYLIANKGKNLFLDIDYKEGFTFCHIAEETAGVDYRYKKTFSGLYNDKKNKLEKVSVSMHVRNIEAKIGMTIIDKKFDNSLKQNDALKKFVEDGINITIVDIEKAYNLMVDDIKTKKNFIYPLKLSL